MACLSLTELLGARVSDPAGATGRVRELVMRPQEDTTRISALLVKTKDGDRLLPFADVTTINSGIRTSRPISQWVSSLETEGLLLLERDLIDQQIIDVHGRKVVRVNDVDLHQDSANNHVVLKVGGVDVGPRGAIRRLLKGLVPMAALRVLLKRIPPREIPWEFVDLIETDPARRVKLKIAHQRLARLHPADIADIIEDLAPDEREAVFETLDENVAAEAMEEIQPKLQASIMESLDSERAADIIEEMDPDAAADLLKELPQETTNEILQEMEPQERNEVSELLEFKEDTAAGRMTTEYMALPATATVNDAIEMLRNFEGGVETVSTVYLIDQNGKLTGAVPLPKLVLARSTDLLGSLSAEPLVSVHAGAGEKDVAELFDKYNLLTLAVVDDEGKLTGVITSDDVISLLRSKL